MSYGIFEVEGEITIDGEEINRGKIHRLAFATGDHSFFPSVTAEDHRLFYKMQFPKFNENRYEALMEFFQLPENKKISEFRNAKSV